ncbi:hypothetical protein PIB30_072985 [Stylosanthes scabra]|uniref:Ubiquitin-like protease family profile domain-containing protein n=1 Tax=Stylosanthes scabra TaxID=79078 RepID=A0ABU6WMH6_9FABA|nr:hypothetical protein [Stylosanthes scabra]
MKFLQIYVPMLLDNHCFLMVVDINHDDLIYLDSCKNIKERASRVEAMTFLVFKLQSMLKDPDFYEQEESQPRPYGDYHVCEPLVTQPRDKLRDCGVYVAQWMQLTCLQTTYDLPLRNFSYVAKN